MKLAIGKDIYPICLCMADMAGEREMTRASCDLAVDNTCFEKRANHLITYSSGRGSTQIDFVLLRVSFPKHVSDVKVISGEGIASQHQLFICDFRTDMSLKA